MSLTTLNLYFITWTLVALSPGPAAMCVMSQATRYGARASLAGIGGIQTGNIIFFICIAMGLASLLATATMAFAVMRMIGAAYLFYLGVRILVSTFRKAGSSAAVTVPAPASGHLFLQGLLIQLTNPKALLFVSALLPQFIDGSRPLGLQIGLLVIVTVVVDVAVMSGYAVLAERGSRTLKSSALATWIERTFGATLVFFGVRIVAAQK